MALQKDKELGNGFTANYWMFSHLSYSKGSRLTIVLELFKDKAARDAGLNPVSSQSFQIPADLYQEFITSNNLVQTLYNYAKAQPEFDGATDV